MELRQQPRHALVLCATRGIGRACAGALARDGVEVTIVARDVAALDAAQSELAEESSAHVRTIEADVASAAGIATVLGHLEIAPDIVVLVPPRHDPLPAEPGADDVQRQFLMEVRNPLDLVEGLLPHMRSRGWGRIVHLTGAAVKRPTGSMLPTASLRSSLITYLRGLSRQEARHGVTVNTVLVGYVDTAGLKDNWQRQAADAGITYDALRTRKLSESSVARLAQPEEIAALVSLLASERGGYITGEAISCDGGRGGCV